MLMLAAAKVASGLAALVAALGPFALVSDVVVAGIFSLVNTILSAVTIYALHRFLSGVPDKVDKAAAILEEQRSHMAKRADDQ